MLELLLQVGTIIHELLLAEAWHEKVLVHATRISNTLKIR